jgi:hypothetical protein
MAARLAALLGVLSLACADILPALPSVSRSCVERSGLVGQVAAWGRGVEGAAWLGLGARRNSAPGDGTGLRLRGGAKSKNHTNHNQNAKAHKNGIKRIKT